MKFERHEYGIGMLPTKSGFDNGLIISRTALEKWKAHYDRTAEEISEDHPSRMFMMGFYLGKSEVLTDILRHFDDED